MRSLHCTGCALPLNENGKHSERHGCVWCPTCFKALDECNHCGVSLNPDQLPYMEPFDAWGLACLCDPCHVAQRESDARRHESFRRLVRFDQLMIGVK